MSLTRIRSFFRNLLHKAQVEEQLDQEVSSYLVMLTEEKMRSGMTREQAMRAAKVELGGSDQVKEQVRDIRAGAWLETLIQDLRFGARMIGRNPGFSSLVILTLALGIGANTAIFSVVYGVLLRPLPYAKGSDLVVLSQELPKANVHNAPFSPQEVFDYRDMNHTLQSVVEYHSMSFLLLKNDGAERVQTGVVSANFFDVLGVKPILGRSFVAADETKDADAVLVLSYEYWMRHQGGDPNIVGKVFQMNNRPHTVIGVLPQIPQYPAENDVYMPTSACPFRSNPQTIANRRAHMLPAVFGRLKSGTSLQQAQADLSTLARQLARQYPDDHPIEYGYDLSVSPLQKELTRRAQTTLLILLGAAGFVLLIACANVANLMLAQLAKRDRELAVRSALGASRPRLIRQLLTETVMLSTLGGVLGLLLAPSALRLLVKFAARFTTRAAEVKIDWHVLIFTLGVSLFTGLLFGCAPAIASARRMNEGLKQASGQATASPSRQRLRATLVIAQVTISFMLLIGAGLMLRSILVLQKVDPGFRIDHLLTMRLSPNFSRYQTTQDFLNMADSVLRHLNSVVGVQTAALTTNYPFSKQGIISGPGKNGMEIEGRPIPKGDTPPQVDTTGVSPEYFTALRQPLLAGRLFTDHDDAKAEQVGIINLAMKNHFWPNEDPIGRRITGDSGQTWIRIVGVVGDAKEYGLTPNVLDEVYQPLKQIGGGTRLVVRTAIDPMSEVPLVRSAIHDVDSQLAIDQIDTMDQLVQDSIASPRTTTILLGIFAGLALLISATGIAGVMALSVSQRSHELGIRMALGQSKSSILQMVLRQGMTLAGAGVVFGLMGALAVARLLSSLLYQTSPKDVETYAAVSILFLAAAAVSCLLPARRVTMIDPSRALRQE